MKENKDIKKAVEKLKEVSEDEKMRRIAELREKAILDERSAIRYATNEGIEKGIEKERVKIVKNMLKNGMDIETIMSITELSKEEIESIK